METRIAEITKNESVPASGEYCEYTSHILKSPRLSRIGGSWCEYRGPLSIGQIYTKYKAFEKHMEQEKEIFSISSFDGRTVFSVTRHTNNNR